MFKKWTYRSKNRLLLTASPVILGIMYFVSIEKTVDLYIENNKLKAQLLQMDKAPQQLKFYESESRRLEKVMSFSSTRGSIKEDILAASAAGADIHKVLFKNLSEPFTYVEENVEIETYEVIFQGDYISLLKMLHYVEENLQSGKVVSSRFKLTSNRRSRYVEAHIFIQTSRVL